MKKSFLFAVILLAGLTGFAPVRAALNDTGIKICSNAMQNGLPCPPVAGFPGQDAEYGTNSFDFTKLDANGNAFVLLNLYESQL